MIPCRLDLPTWRNADYSESFPALDGDVPIDLTDLVFRGEARRYVGDTLPLLTLAMAADLAEGINVPVPTDGVFEITINQSTLSDLYGQVAFSNEVVKLSFDLLVTYVDGFTETWAQGLLIINPGVSQ